MSAAILIAGCSPSSTEQPVATPRTWFVIQAHGAKLYDSPSDDAREVGTPLPYGEAVQIIEEPEQTHWVRISAGNRAGWVSISNLNTHPIEAERVLANDFRGMVFFNRPSLLKNGGSGAVLHPSQYAYHLYSRGTASIVLLQKGRRRIRSSIEWLITDSIVLLDSRQQLVLPGTHSCFDRQKVPAVLNRNAKGTSLPNRDRYAAV